MNFARIYTRLWARHQIPMRAGALTYTLLLSIIPLLAVCLSVFSLFVDVKKLSIDFKAALFKHLATGAGSAVGKTLDAILENVQFKTLGYAGSAALLVIALLLLASVEDSINRIWSIRRKKEIWKRVIIYNLFIFLGPVSVSLSIATTTIVTKFFPELLLKANLGVVFVSTLFLAITYKVFPNRKVSLAAAVIPAFIVAIASEFAKWGYAGYMVKMLVHNKIYGGFAALPLFLIWVYLNWILFLSGALLSFMIQNYKSFKVSGRVS